MLDVGGDSVSSGRMVQLRCVTSHFQGRRCHTGPKSSQDAFPHWSFFLFYTLGPLGWSGSPSRYQSGEVSAFPSSPAQLKDSFHTSLPSPTKVAWFPTVLGRFISIFPCQLTRLPTALCRIAALCALHTCSKLLFLDKARRQIPFIKVRTLGEHN